MRISNMKIHSSETMAKKLVSNNLLFELKLERQRVTKKKEAITLYFDSYEAKLDFMEIYQSEWEEAGIKIVVTRDDPALIYNADNLDAAHKAVDAIFNSEDKD